jgi:uncharacterized protein YkwD
VKISRRPGFAGTLARILTITTVVIATWARGSKLPEAAQTESSAQPDTGSSSGWHHFGESKASSAPGPITRISSRLDAAEREMYGLINRDRSEHGAAPLRWDNQLAALARAHSRDMVAHRYFAHVDPDGRSPGMRLKAAGIAWRSVGENIATNGDVETAEAAFMNEPHRGQNHRANILDPRFTEVGVGIVAGAGGQLFITQEFMNPAEDLHAAFPR